MEIRCRKSGVSEIRCRSIILAREIRCRSIILAREIRCHAEIRSQSIILACGNPVSVHHSCPKRCGNMRKSGLSPSFLPEKIRKDEPTPDYAPRKDEPTPDYARHRITPPAMEIRCRGNPVSVHHSCPSEIRSQSIILAREIRCRGNPVSVHHSCPRKSGEIRCHGEIRCQSIILGKSGVSPSFLPEKMRKFGVSPSFLPEKMRKDEPTPDYALVPAPRQFLVLPLQAQVHDPLEPHQFDAIRVRTEVRRLHAQPVANR